MMGNYQVRFGGGRMEKGAAGSPSLLTHNGLTNPGISRDLASRLPDFLTLAEEAELRRSRRGGPPRPHPESSHRARRPGRVRRSASSARSWWRGFDVDLLFYHLELRCYVVIELYVVHHIIGLVWPIWLCGGQAISFGNSRTFRGLNAT